MINSNEIFNITNNEKFTETALSIFRSQAANNNLYKRYLELNHILLHEVNSLTQIPFFPINFFKSFKITTGSDKEEAIFTSSGTTGKNTSKHYVNDLSIYQKSFTTCFQHFYGNPADFCFLALLPSYLERKDSSLIYMMKHLISKSKYRQSGFYLNNIDELYGTLTNIKEKKIPTVLVGVTYALLDFTEKYNVSMDTLIVMETGGMKGKRKEITRSELHEKLTNGFGVKKIHSEYGMTELLSQAYSKGEGRFNTPSWMKVLIRDSYDPKDYVKNGKTGGINIIDLANVNSISFIETMDLGKINSDGSFEILGRIDNSELRGCNLLLAE